MTNNQFLTKILNNSYNFFFKKFNNINLDKKEDKILVKQNLKHIKNSTALQTSWLLNLKRLYILTNKNIDISDYHFLDVGCGNGIPLIYAYKNLNFKSYAGFDFVSKYLKTTKKNIKSAIGTNKILVFNSDAAKIKLSNKSYFIFMFNPFDEKIMRKFIKNNLKNLKKNKSVIAYSNYNQLQVVKKYSKKISIIKRYKLASCFF